jgi:ankyrin repeat protein
MKHLTSFKLFETVTPKGTNTMGEDLVGDVSDIESVKDLISKGVDVNYIGGFHNDSALHRCAIHQCYDTMKLLIKNGADVNIRDKEGNTPLMFAARYRENENTEILKLLIDNGADMDIQNKDRNTALILTTVFDLIDNAKYLIKAGADVTIIGNDDKTFIDYVKTDENFHYSLTKIYDWLNTLEAQEIILTKWPLLYKSFIEKGIEIHEKFNYLTTSKELGLT